MEPVIANIFKFLIAALFLSVGLVEAVCHFTPTSSRITTKSGEIQSQLGYNDNQDCKWTFSPQAKRNIMKITLNQYKIEESKNCSKDAIVIHDKRLCGTARESTCFIFTKLQNLGKCPSRLVNESCQTRYLDGNSWPPTIAFESDNSGTAKGLRVSYDFYSCKTPEVVQPRITVRIGSPKIQNTQVVVTKTPSVRRSVSVTSGSVTSATDSLDSIGNDTADFTTLTIIILLAMILVLAASLAAILLWRKCRQITTKSEEDIAAPSPNEEIYESIPEKTSGAKKIHDENESHYGMVENVIYDRQF